MAHVVRCDKCGKVYPHTQNGNKAIRAFYTDHKGDLINTPALPAVQFDLCKTCFENFMKEITVNGD